MSGTSCTGPGLGSGLQAAIDKLVHAPVVDEAALTKFTNQLAAALLRADVDIHLVRRVQSNVKATLEMELPAPTPVQLPGFTDATAPDLNAAVSKPQQLKRRRAAEAAVVRELCVLLGSSEGPSSPMMAWQPSKGTTSVVCFTGLQGSGKTTTCVKYAHYFRSRGFTAALVGADTFRAGACDQLRQSATKARLPYFCCDTAIDPVPVAVEGVARFRAEGFHLIVVDTAGRHAQDAALAQELRAVLEAVEPDHVVYVVDSGIGQQARRHAEAFQTTVSGAAPQATRSIVLSKMDGGGLDRAGLSTSVASGRGGGALASLAALPGSRVAFVGTGEHVGDLEPFKPRAYVSRLLGLGDLQGLMRLFEERRQDPSGRLGQQASRLERKLFGTTTTADGSSGFSMSDLGAQIEMLLQMGPVSSLLSMLPDLSAVLRDGTSTGSSGSTNSSKHGTPDASDLERMLRRILVVLDSMTPEELAFTSSKQFATTPPRPRPRRPRVALGDTRSAVPVNANAKGNASDPRRAHPPGPEVPSDVMTKAEMQRVWQSRVRRLARGSGSTEADVGRCLDIFRPMSKVFQTLKTLPAHLQQAAQSVDAAGATDEATLSRVVNDTMNSMGLGQQLRGKHKQQLSAMVERLTGTRLKL